jgi:hypothetical protein
LGPALIVVEHMGQFGFPHYLYMYCALDSCSSGGQGRVVDRVSDGGRDFVPAQIVVRSGVVELLDSIAGNGLFREDCMLMVLLGEPEKVIA